MATPAVSQRETGEHVWAFDLGKGSIGEAVRCGSKIEYAASLLIPADLAQRGPATKAGTPASRYRAMKTREAHRAREERLSAICAEAGIEVLAAKRVGRNSNGKWQVVQEADERLTREFPAKGDNTCYTSCLLRIKLLQGEPLASWQVFKALFSAIQRRGYDPKPAWIRSRTAQRNEKNDDALATSQRMNAYRDALEHIAPGQSDYHYPSYVDAWRMGLWDPAKPKELILRIDHNTEPARNRGEDGAIVAPRELVEKELRQLLLQAAKEFPKLAGKADQIIHGPGGKAYASYYADIRKLHGLRRGGVNDWLGVLGQKVPRFDNRIIAKCALIPRLNVCKAGIRNDAAGNPVPDSLLPSEVTFLLKLKNIRVQRADKRIAGLTAREISDIFSRPEREPGKLSFTESQWKRECAKLGALPVPGHEEVRAPKEGGRSRFSRPALQILKRVILSGEAPITAHTREVVTLNGNTDPCKGLVPNDLKFMLRMGDTWDTLYVPDQQHDALFRLRVEKGRDEAIRALLGSVNDPIVRHRLETFWHRLYELEQGGELNPPLVTPDHIVLEFVRDDFLGADAKRDLQRFQNEREKARKEAREKAKELNATGRAAGLKYELLKQQGFRCLYTGQSLGETQLDELQIEHIVPRTQGGPDAVVNYVVTTGATNDEKGNRTPYEWFAAKGFAGWDAYVARVNTCATQLRNKKVRLLTSPDAADLVQRYTALAETAWIARLSQTLVALYFGWPIRSEEGNRRITIVSGGLTARVRRLYRLNSLLHGPAPEGVDPLDWEEQCDKKNRDDDRHHALDAMVISFIPGWARDPKKEGFFRLPEGVTRETFAAALTRVLPANLFMERAVLEATAYGERVLAQGRFAVARADFKSVAVKTERSGKRSLRPRKDIETHRIVDPVIRRDVETFLSAAGEPTTDAWDAWCEAYRRGGPHGPRVKKVLLTVSKPDDISEYSDLSKDQTGQLCRGAKHKGYFIVEVPAPTKNAPYKRALSVRPVYAHQSPYNVNATIASEAGARVLGFFESGCTVQIDARIEHSKTPLMPGVYRLNSIWEQGNIVVTDQASNVSAPIGLARFIAAGLRRVR
jgi:CRISPR-associated endonuclease Csn1